jgi:hypothetical protein
MLAYGRQKPAFSHFVARIFKKILAEQSSAIPALWGPMPLNMPTPLP